MWECEEWERKQILYTGKEDRRTISQTFRMTDGEVGACKMEKEIEKTTIDVKMSGMRRRKCNRKFRNKEGKTERSNIQKRRRGKNKKSV